MGLIPWPRSASGGRARPVACRDAVRDRPDPAASASATVPGVTELLDAAVTAVGGTRRDGQDAMAQAVRQAIVSGEHLAVQAGTGTGKSLAYLVPAIRHAVERGTTVVVSTATIALQRQLVDRDLPRLAKALKPLLGRAPTFAILKGRRNYLCLNKLHGNGDDVDEGDQLFDPFAISALGRTVKRIHEWSSDTATGDRDELVPGVPESAWRQVSVSARECLGASRCPVGDDCFAEKARAEAGRADVVVTNHALLAIDALEGRPVLPEHDVVIVDEAHELVDRITGVATAELTTGAVTAAARRCGKLVDQAVADRLVEAGEGLALVLEDLPPGRWESLPRAAAGVLSAVRDAAVSCKQSLGGERREDPEGAAGRKVAQASLDEVADTAFRLLNAFDEPDAARRRDVVWLAEQGPDGARSRVLRAAPLAVGGLLRERLFGRSTVILTSATLTLGGTFDALARQWGLPPEQADGGAATPAPTPGERAGRDPGHGPVQDPDAPRWSGLDVGSPFQHAKSGILYVAKRLPPPGRDGLPPAYLDEIAGLVEAAGGRTLGLVLVDAGREAGHRGAARPARHPAAVPGRRLDDVAGQAVRRGRGDVAVRHALALAGRRRARAVAVVRDHRPDPVPAPGRPAGGGPAAGRRLPRRQRLPHRLRDARRPAARAGRGPAAARHGRPRRRRDPRPAAGDGPLRRLPAGLAPAVLADRRPGEGPRRPAPPPRRPP